MSKTEEMRIQLAPLNIYNLNGTSLIDCELAAYGASLDSLQSRLDKLLNSLWVITADDETLSLWEQRLGFCGGENNEERRRKILRRLQSNKASDFTRLGIEDYLNEEGFYGVVVDDFYNLSARLHHWDDRATLEDYIPYVKLARDVVPVHVQVSIELLQENWNQTDARGYDFDRWDSASLHWDVNWEGE